MRNRVKDYDYSGDGGYFLTICLQNRQNQLWKPNFYEPIARGADFESLLSERGKIVNEAIKNIPVYYPSVTLDKYVIMPNHIHLLLILQNDARGSAMRSPTISVIINQMKGYVTKRLGTSIWQRSFYDHVIRGKEDYEKIWEYIDKNPPKWAEDDF